MELIDEQAALLGREVPGLIAMAIKSAAQLLRCYISCLHDVAVRPEGNTRVAWFYIQTG